MIPVVLVQKQLLTHTKQDICFSLNILYIRAFVVKLISVQLLVETLSVKLLKASSCSSSNICFCLQTFVNDVRIQEQSYVTLKTEDKLRFGYDIL